MTEQRLGSALLLVAPLLAAVFLQVGWGRWPDVLIDFGRELYVPWRLAEGEVLYRDIAWFNGPLSAYVNAGLFKLFGVGFWTLAWANIVVLALFSVLLVRYLSTISTRFAAAGALLFFLAVFACGQQVSAGNYNFISPYSHEVTHGLVLSILSLACVVRHRIVLATRWLVLAGLALGLVFLTKIEITIAATLGVFSTLLLSSIATRSSRELISRTAIVLSAALIAPALAALALATAMPLGEAVQGVLGAWSAVSDDALTELEYYRHGMGFDEPGRNLLAMILAFGVMLLAIGPGYAASRWLAGPRSRVRAVFVGAGVFTLAFIAWRLSGTEWRWLARATTLSLVLLLLIGVCALPRIVHFELRAAWAEFLGFTIFALALLLKMILQVRFGHYGFVLAAPASLALFVFVVGWLPRFVQYARDRSGSSTTGTARVYVIAAALGMYSACGVALWEKSAIQFAAKRVPVGEGRDRILADMRGVFVNDALVEIQARLEPGGELLVLPEGVSINYFARVRTPTPYLNFMPPELILFGEAEIVRALEARPPALILLSHKDTSEYGYPFFGRDYGKELADWVLAHYEHVWTNPRGGYPLQPATVFGMSILEPIR